MIAGCTARARSVQRRMAGPDRRTGLLPRPGAVGIWTSLGKAGPAIHHPPAPPRTAVTCCDRRGTVVLKPLLQGTNGAPGGYFTNLLFDGDRLVGVIDWQTALRGPGTLDLTSLLCTSLTVEDRRRHEDDLLDRYTSALGNHGIALGLDIHRAYREGMLWWMALFANNLSTISPTGRGRLMFDLVVERLFAAAVDHDAGRELD